MIIDSHKTQTQPDSQRNIQQIYNIYSVGLDERKPRQCGDTHVSNNSPQCARFRGQQPYRPVISYQHTTLHTRANIIFSI
jgi:hypothetical protein